MGTFEGLIGGMIITISTLFFVGFAVLGTDALGTITVTQSFQEEFNSCQAQLKTATTPQCAPVECKNEGTGLAWVWTISGLILWGSALYYWNVYAPKKAEAAKAKTK